MSLDEYLERNSINLNLKFSYRRREWLDLASRVKKADGHKCRICRSDHGLVVHHIIPLIHGGLDDESNLITVCRGCHSVIHHRTYHGGLSWSLRWSRLKEISRSSKAPLLDIVREFEAPPEIARRWLREIESERLGWPCDPEYFDTTVLAGLFKEMVI